jgi:hypothetical protein
MRWLLKVTQPLKILAGKRSSLAVGDKLILVNVHYLGENVKVEALDVEVGK